jgi:PIN domain nuclease of toxin-antitoxin system
VGGWVLIVLDTHTLLWWQAGSERLSRPARFRIEKAARILVSPISLWEIALLVRRGRFELDRNPFDWATDLLAEDRIELAPLTATAAVGAGLLPADGFEGDPADCIIYATARELMVPLVTKDDRMHRFAAAARGMRIVW